MLSSWFTMLSLAVFAQDGFLNDFSKKWQSAMEYTLEFAEAMPARLYDYRPTEDQMPFHRQLTHIAGNMIWLSTAFLGGTDFEGELHNLPESKEKVRDHLRQAFEYTARVTANFDPARLDDTVEFVDGPLTKRQIFLLLNDHVTHHRGQLVVYLRLNDIKPPAFRGW